MRIIISPHLDDAVLSVGQTVQNLDGDTIVETVFAGVPKAGVLSAYDKSCGFLSSQQAMMIRRQEDAKAVASLGASSDHWPYFDRQYETRNDTGLLMHELSMYIEQQCERWAPIGLGHPDHVDLSEMCARAWHGAVLFYEELPYRVLWPEQVVARMEELRDLGWTFQEVPFPYVQGSRNVKAEAIRQYRSQFPKGVDDPCLFVPERVWLATR